MNTQFSTIGLLGKEGDERVIRTLGTVAGHLARRGFHVRVDTATALLLPDLDHQCLERDALGRQCDLVVVIGGDGTMLNAARSLASYDVPLVGINLGRLGFLTDIPREDVISALDSILAGEYLSDRRCLLEAGIMHADGEGSVDVALNDAVIQKADGGRMIEFDTHVDGAYVCSHRADGLVVATPTGSTAYALSGGGPILHPSLEAIALVPICPHTLSDRPLALASDSVVEVVLRGREESQAQLIWDGQRHAGLSWGDRVRIRKSVLSVTLLHPRDHDYFRILRNKLHWGRSEHMDGTR
ncbi:MAG: NAD(+) kinase [Gammaproteobacteria bacterium]|jgi:NAD+ kinase